MNQPIQLLDTFPAFLSWWQTARDLPVEEQIASWATAHMAEWPDLLTLLIEDYRSQQLSWQQVARDRVFPDLAQRLAAMHQAHQNLLDLVTPIYTKAQQTLDFSSPVTFVIYVGIGCGAGWVTPYQQSPGILFGLENIAECGWSHPETIAGLLAHEIGHLVHQHWRAQQSLPSGTDAWWQLYEEGFAQICESLVLGSPSWHQASSDDTWLAWCQAKQSWLAAEFLKTVDAGQAVTPFFGSWFDIGGKKQTGYFLGCQVIQQLLQQCNLQEIALFNDIEGQLRPILQQMAHNEA